MYKYKVYQRIYLSLTKQGLSSVLASKHALEHSGLTLFELKSCQMPDLASKTPNQSSTYSTPNATGGHRSYKHKERNKGYTVKPLSKSQLSENRKRGRHRTRVKRREHKPSYNTLNEAIAASNRCVSVHWKEPKVIKGYGKGQKQDTNRKSNIG